MRFTLRITIFIFLFASFIIAQDSSREQRFQQLIELNSQIRTLEKEFLLPDAKDLKRAQTQNFNVFRLMPREKFDRQFIIQGGGSNFSFTTGSHDYQKIAQIGLEQNNLKVGFAGADYGFIADLGETSLTDITEETAEVNFLINYKPPTNEPDVRFEQRKTHNYEANGLTYKAYNPAVVGHSYVLRAISFDSADVLVAFKVHRKDTDGSLIIFWKLIKNFEKPTFERAK